MIVRRERQRQKTLAAQQAKEPPRDPAKVVVRTELCPIKGFRSWSECGVPIHVLLIRETYADQHQDQWALMDTGDGSDPRQPKAQYGLRTKIEERHRLLKCFHDLSDFHSRCFNVIVAQVAFILLSCTLRQWQLWKFRQPELAGKTPGFLGRQFNRYSEYVVIYYQNAYTRMPLVTFSRELLEMPAAARAKALSKVRQLEQSFLTPWKTCAPPRNRRWPTTAGVQSAPSGERRSFLSSVLAEVPKENFSLSDQPRPRLPLRLGSLSLISCRGFPQIFPRAVPIGLWPFPHCLNRRTPNPTTPNPMLAVIPNSVITVAATVRCCDPLSWLILSQRVWLLP